jgi:hypothetical protein
MGLGPDEAKAAIRDQMHKAGYAEYHTGGGCVVWNKDIDQSRYPWTSTDDNDLFGGPNANIWIAGTYSGHGENWLNVTGLTLDEAVEILPRLPTTAIDSFARVVRIRDSHLRRFPNTASFGLEFRLAHSVTAAKGENMQRQKKGLVLPAAIDVDEVIASRPWPRHSLTVSRSASWPIAASGPVGFFDAPRPSRSARPSAAKKLPAALNLLEFSDGVDLGFEPQGLQGDRP